MSVTGIGLSTNAGASDRDALVEAMVDRHLTTTQFNDIMSKYNIPTIGSYAFAGMNSLVGPLSIPGGVSIIGSNAFTSCQYITSVDMSLATNITNINPSTFEGCATLGTVILPQNLQGIYQKAFRSCWITDIVFPSSLTRIEKEAFYDSLHGTGTARFELDLSGTQVTSILQQAFGQCSLSNVRLPSTLTSVSIEAFDGSVFGQDVTIFATTPPAVTDTGVGWMLGVSNIYVPAASVDAYKAAAGWSPYASKIQAIPNS